MVLLKFNMTCRWKYGILAQDESEIYFLGVIDILQHYNWVKKIEVFWKIKILRQNEVCGFFSNVFSIIFWEFWRVVHDNFRKLVKFQ